VRDSFFAFWKNFLYNDGGLFLEKQDSEKMDFRGKVR
jgi:hypothetical protein